MNNPFQNLNTIFPGNRSEGGSINPDQLKYLATQEDKIPVEQGLEIALQASEFNLSAHPASVGQALGLLGVLKKLIRESGSGTATVALSASHRIISQIKRMNPELENPIDTMQLTASVLEAAEESSFSLQTNHAYTELKTILYS